MSKTNPYWPLQAIDLHQVKPGIGELQTMMAVGQVAQSDSSSYGNRTVTYTAGDRKVTVTFAHDKATQIQEATGHA
jgi:hypothetical protein